MQFSVMVDRLPEVADIGSRQNVHVPASPQQQQQYAETGVQIAGPRVHHANHTDVASILLQSATDGTFAWARDETLVSTGNRSRAVRVQSDGALRYRMVSNVAGVSASRTVVFKRRLSE